MSMTPPTAPAFDSAHPSLPSLLPLSLYFFLGYDLNGYSSIDAAPTMTIPAPLPPPAFPAITGYYPSSAVPAEMCSFPENSSASPPSTQSGFMKETRTWIPVDLRLV
ncbi:hypothetical protein CPC08DRAFT_714617 [Agrocybe pediades]|nr:hypothetical protein CPC08DRAFT_714617 [Agrocybe pediades]